jgi:membrane protease YdiL (CAAX protease family)
VGVRTGLARGARLRWGSAVRRFGGTLLLAGSAAAAGHLVLPPLAPLLLGALGLLAAMGVGAYWLGSAPFAFLVAGVAHGLGGGRLAPLPVWGAAALLGLYAAAVALLARRRPRRALGPTDGFLAVALMVLLSACFSLLAPIPPPGPTERHVSVLLVLYLATPPIEMLTVILVLSRDRLLGQFWRENYRGRAGLAGAIGHGLVVGIGIVLLTAAVVQIEARGFRWPIQPNNPFVYNPRLATAPPGALAALVLAVVVMAPLAEEALFRGLLFGGLRRRVGPVLAALVSAAVFGAAHMNGSLFLPLAVAGFLLALVYERSRSLWPSTVAHATLNGLAVLMALLVR